MHSGTLVPRLPSSFQKCELRQGVYTVFFYRVKQPALCFCFHTHFCTSSVFMTEDCEMQDDFSTVFFLRLQYRAHSLCPHLCKRFHLHDRRRELKDCIDTMFFLKDGLVALSLCFHSHSETCFHNHERWWELEDPFNTLFLLRVTSMAVYLRFNVHIGNPWYFHWLMLPSLDTNLVHWID